MSADLLPWLPLIAKLLLTAAIVVTASVVVERAGAVTGALVATLPVTTWPAYVFLALDHDGAYMAQAALSGLAVNAANGLFFMVYAGLARTRGLLVSLSVAAACWIALALLTRSIAWTLASAALVNLLAYPAYLWLGRNIRTGHIPRLPRAWYDVPLRAVLVCALMTAVLVAGQVAGPGLTGIIAVYPISSTSLVLILQPRVGGPAAAAVVANSAWSILGLGLGLAALHLLIVPLGAAASLAIALAIPMAWNMMVWTLHRRAVAAAH